MGGQVVPAWYERSFAGLAGSAVDFFGEVVQQRKRGDRFRIAVVAEGMVFLAKPDGHIKANYEVDDIRGVSVRGDTTVLAMLDGKVLKLKTEGPGLKNAIETAKVGLAEAAALTGKRRKTRRTPTPPKQEECTPPAPEFRRGASSPRYVASDRICTACDDGSAHYAVAVYVCHTCDEKYCAACWDAAHPPAHPALSQHTQEPLVHKCERCLLRPAMRGTVLGVCEACARHASLPHGGSLSPRSLTPAAHHDGHLRAMRGTRVPLPTPSPSPDRSPSWAEQVTAQPPPQQQQQQPPPPSLSPGVAGGAQEPRVFKVGGVEMVEHVGCFLPKGGDLFAPQALTPAAALKLAASDSRCLGITFRGPPVAALTPLAAAAHSPPCEGAAEAVCYVFYKALLGRLTRAAPWCTYIKRQAGAGDVAPPPLPPPPPADTTPPPAEKEAAAAQPPRSTFLPASFDNPSAAACSMLRRGLLVACENHADVLRAAPSPPRADRAHRVLHEWLRGSGARGDLRLLTDRNPDAAPSRPNLLASFKWLARGARPGDALFFSFIGHGGRGALVPSDVAASGPMPGGEFEAAVLRKVPPGVAVTVVADFCGGGHLLDLPYRASIGSALTPEGEMAPAEIVTTATTVDMQPPVDGALPEGVRPSARRYREVRAQTACRDAERVRVVQLSGEVPGPHGFAPGDVALAFAAAFERLTAPRPTYEQLLRGAWVELNRIAPPWRPQPGVEGDGAGSLEGSPLPRLVVASNRPFGLNDEALLLMSDGAGGVGAGAECRSGAEEQLREKQMAADVLRCCDKDGDGFLGYYDMCTLCAKVAAPPMTRVAYDNLCKFCGTLTGLGERDLLRVYRELFPPGRLTEHHACITGLPSVAIPSMTGTPGSAPRDPDAASSSASASSDLGDAPPTPPADSPAGKVNTATALDNDVVDVADLDTSSGEGAAPAPADDADADDPWEVDADDEEEEEKEEEEEEGA